MALLEVSNLGIAFGGLQAVAQLDLSIEKGHLYGLIGPNGAGKTTVFNMLTGVYKPTEGNIVLDGKDITGKNPELISKAGVARTFQNIRLFNEMSVLDNVKVGLHNQLEEFRRILGAAAYDVDVPALEYTVVRVLRENGLHAATAESCTGGMIAERLTNVPGSSEVFGYGFVTYAEAAKQKLLGVPAETIAQYNVVSGPVAAAMAFGAAKESGAELAVGITGLAGPGGELPGKPVGTVYLAGADARTNTGCLMRLTLGGYRERSVIRARAAMYALDMLRRMALGLPVPDSLAITPDTPATTMDI